MTMITNTPTHYLGSKDCEFTINGENLVSMRRSRLRGYAKKFGVSPADSKQHILKRIIGKLKVAGAPKELIDL